MVMELIKIALMLAMYGAGWVFITAELAKRTIANGTSRDRDQAIKWASRIALAWPLILPFLAALGLVVWVAGAVKNQIKNRLPMPDAELNALEREVLADQARDEAVGQDYSTPGADAEMERIRQRFLDQHSQVTVCRKCLCPVVQISAYTYIHSPELGAPAPCSVEHPSETTMSRENWRRAINAQSPEYQRWVELKNNLGKVKMRAPGVERAIWVKESAVPIHARSGWKVVEGPYEPEDLAAFEITDEVEELAARWKGHMITNGPDKITILDRGMEYREYAERAVPRRERRRRFCDHGAYLQCDRCRDDWPAGMF